MTNAVWITGVGSLTNLGTGYGSLLSAVDHPRARFDRTPPEWFHFSGVPDTYMARLDAVAEAEIKTFETVATDRATAMALAVTAQAWQGADLREVTSSERAGVYWGTGMGGLDTTEATYQRIFVEHAPIRPMTVVRIMANAAAAQIALKYRLQGANQTYSTACSSSAMAMGEAMWAIRSGRMDCALVGGADAMLAPGSLTAWGALKVLATRKNCVNPTIPCRPFSSERSGLVIGEGAAAFVLESAQHAIARGAKPLAELAGYASTCDATSLVHPSVNGQVRSMRLALQDAGMRADAIDCVNAHATATETGDLVEAQSLMEVFGQHGPSVVATKAMHGHLLGAAGAVEAAMCLASIQKQMTPATLGCDPIDQRCSGIDVFAEPRKTRIHAILSNSFAFGGSNVSLIFKSFA